MGQWNEYLDKLKKRVIKPQESRTTEMTLPFVPENEQGGLCLKCMRTGVLHGVCPHCGATEADWKNRPKMLPAGTILSGRYVVGTVLGRGGFGVTYIGYDLKTGERVAIKEFFPNLPKVERASDGIHVDAEGSDYFGYGLKRFCDEGQMIYRYRTHPNIIHVLKLFQENNTAYYAMEYLEGEDLSHYRKHMGGRLRYDQLLLLLLPVMDALACIHRDYVIHRDVSPDNIYIGSTVKLIDFGASRIAVAGQSHSLSVILKQPFAPEEQYRKRGRQGPWTDIYALAATMYLCLTGQLIPDAQSRRGEDRIKDIRSFPIEIPENASAAIMRALAVKADDRYHTIGEFRAALLGESFHGQKSETVQDPKCPLERFRLYGIRGVYAGQNLVENGRLTIGRDPAKCQLLYPGQTQGISRIHASLWLDPGQRGIFIRDEGSTYGTFVNGRRIPAGEKQTLHCHDRIVLGGAEEFEIEF
ncbi:MAG: FHA domain-containing serine/threonine-protein kinase [Lachnospiraceae bacterium]|nr:FHA domain-containing serine/threonine-protein kinase [Lachnospiraceae bacterium]MCD7765200.1 FHA domain-containing serine/threonine-protein kinase [Lachnospiraceae bacterium]